MKLVVFGSTGGIGAQVVAQALGAGHEVTAVARKPTAVTIRHECLQVVAGDVLDPASVRAAIAGKDAVISAVGARNRAPTTIYSTGVANMLTAMQDLKVRRLLCISASGLDPGPLWQRLIAKPILWALFREMYSDLVRMENEVKRSNLDWTIIRPPALRNGPRTGHYQIAVNGKLAGLSISRADVADYMLKHVADATSFRAVVEIAY